MRIAVIGAGTGGAAAALFLARKGHSVEVFERVSDPKPVGAGILLQPTGMQVMAALGLLAPILAHGARIDRLDGVTLSGRKVIELAYDDIAPGLFGLGIHRGVLFETLYGALRAENISVRTGISVDRLDAGPDGVAVAGEWFDRVVVADGARSQLRPAFARMRRYPWGALWCMLPEDARYVGTLSQVYRDTRRMVGFLPTGRPPGGGAPLVSMFWSLRADAVPAWKAAGIDVWKGEVHEIAPFVDLAAVGAGDVLFAPYFDVVMPRWHTDRVVWIGDCGHAMSPQLGQGANLALMDAMVLGECGSFAEYSDRRRAHLRFYQFASRWLTPFFQSSFPVLSPFRDTFAMPFHRWGWYRRQMLLSLAGVKTGLFSTLSTVPLLPPPSDGGATG